MIQRIVAPSVILLAIITCSGIVAKANSVTFTTGNNPAIFSVTITAPGGFTDLRQPRISGAMANANVPEPATMLLFGIGLFGTATAIRKGRR